jgi:hypothetical protein
VAVLLVAHAGLERAEHPEFAFDRNAAEMGFSEPSIITEVKPDWIAVMQVAGSLP